MNDGTVSIQKQPSPDEGLKPETIMGNIYGLFPSVALLAGMQLDLFTPLKDGPLSSKALADILGVGDDKLEPLLYSLVVAGLLQVENGIFANTDEAGKFLVSGAPNYIGGLSGLYSLLLTMTMKTAESVKSGRPQAKFDFHTLPDEELMSYFRRQIHSSRQGGKEIAEKVDFSNFKVVLDAGGGTGGVSMALCAKYPHLRAVVADLPRVTKISEQFIAEAGMSDRIGVSATDLRSEPPAGKFDVAVLRALIQTLSRKESQATLKHIGESMSPGGKIYIFGNVLKNSRLEPPASIAFSLVFLNVYEDGKAYTESEYYDLLTQAGFTEVIIEHNIFVDGMGMVSATKI